MKNFSNIYFSRGILSEKDSGRRKWTAADKRSHETEERKKALKGCIKCVCVCVCVCAYWWWWWWWWWWGFVGPHWDLLLGHTHWDEPSESSGHSLAANCHSLLVIITFWCKAVFTKSSSPLHIHTEYLIRIVLPEHIFLIKNNKY